MLRKFLLFNLVLGIIAAMIYFFGWDEDIVNTYRDWKHDRGLPDILSFTLSLFRASSPDCPHKRH